MGCCYYGSGSGEGRKGRVKLLAFGNKVRPSSKGHFSGSRPVEPMMPRNRLICPLSRRVKTPTGPMIGGNSYILGKRLVTRTKKFMSSPVCSSISNGIGKLRRHFGPAKSRIRYVIMRGSKRCGRIRCRPMGPLRRVAERRVVGGVKSTKVMKVNNTKFPAGMGLSPGRPSGVRCVVTGYTRYRPCVATSCEEVLRCARSLIDKVGIVLSLFPGTENIFTMRSGGGSYVRGLRGTITNRPEVSIGTLVAGCPRKTRHRLVCTIAGQTVGSAVLPTSTKYVISGIRALVKVRGTMVGKGPLVRHIIAIDNSTIRGPKGFVTPFKVGRERLIRTTKNLGTRPRGLVSKKPVVKFTVIAVSTPIAGASSSVLLFGRSIITGDLRATYVGYKEYIRVYPDEVVPSELTSFSGEGSRTSFIT